MAKLLFDDYDFQNKWIRILTHPVLLSFFNSLLIIILIIFGTLIATRDGNFFTDNFDIQVPNLKWSYTFDEHTFKYDQLKRIGVASNDNHGFFDTDVNTL